MMNPLPLAWAEARRQPLGVGAIVILVAAAISFGIATSALERSLRQSSARAADGFDLVVGAPGSATQLVLAVVYLRPEPIEMLAPDVVASMASLPGVASAAPVAFGDSVEGRALVGTTAAFATRGRPLAAGRAFASPHEAVAGAKTPFAIGRTLRPSHGTGREAEAQEARHAYSFTVVGRAPPTGTPWDSAVLVPFAALSDLHHHEDAGASAVVLKPRSVADAYRLRQALRARSLTAVFPGEVLVELYDLMGDMRDATLMLARASQALVVAAVLLALLAVVASRRASCAVLRALGAPPRYVFAVAWLQCFGIFAAGAMLGLAGGWAGAHLLGQALAQATGIEIGVTLRAFEWREVAWELAALAVAATLPAFTALRGDIAEGLRTA